MKTLLTSALLTALLSLVLPPAGSGKVQPASGRTNSDSVEYFVYVDYCGVRYNKNLRKHEMVLRVVMLPATLLKKMPRLKDDGLWSARNSRISRRQQEFLKKTGGDIVTVPIDRYKYYAFYPQGLRKGAIIEAREYNQWDFLEPSAPATAPAPEPRPRVYPTWYRFFWYQYDPVIIRTT